VESAGQRDVLSRQGFCRMQGYLFGKPVAPEEFALGLDLGSVTPAHTLPLEESR
jgi:EAL domain-containing protein (putative c-di-GMP-specific phosphodiesterase class I)